MTDTIRLTFCIPVYNFGGFIADTLDSIAPSLLRHPEIEAVVLDGGSTDDTEPVVRDYCRRLPRIRYVRESKRGGIDADMARSVALARGQYCWLLSGDDIVRPTAVDDLFALLDEGHDIYLCEHTQCDIAMRFLGNYPVFRRRDGFVVNLGNTAERRRYLADALNSEALFSFMSSVVVRRQKWQSTPEPVAFMGTCWGHVARLLSSADPELQVRVVGRQWIDRRGDNDSFRADGMVRRLAIAVDGYRKIAEHFYGADSVEAAEIRRLIRNDLRISLFLRVRVLCSRTPEKEDRRMLDRLVKELYADPRLDCVTARMLFLGIPDFLIEQTATVYGLIRHLVNGLTGPHSDGGSTNTVRQDR